MKTVFSGQINENKKITHKDIKEVFDIEY